MQASPAAPRATIVVVAGAASRELVARTVTSALAQTEPAIEVLVVATAPPERDLGEVAADPRLRTLGLPDASVGALLQAALERSRAPYVHVARAGDVLRPSFVARHLAAQEAYPPAALTVCREDVGDDGHGDDRDDDGDGASASAAPRSPGRPALLRALLGGASVPFACAMLRRDAALAAGGFDATFARHAADDLLFRMLPRTAVRGIDEALVVLAERADDGGAIGAAERGRALVRAFRSCSMDEIGAALADGAWRAPAAARLELAEILAGSPLVEAASLARTAALEALQRGGALPGDASFETLRALAPELARPGLDAALQQGGHAPEDRVSSADAGRDAHGPELFPPRLAVAVWAPSIRALALERMLDDAAALRAGGSDVLLIGPVGDGSLGSWESAGGRVEALQWQDSEDEIAALLTRTGVGVVLAEADTVVAAAARRLGVVVLDGPRRDADPARAVRRDIAAAASAQAGEARRAADVAWTKLRAERAATTALRLAAAGLGDPGSVTGQPGARLLWSDAQRHDLVEIAHEASALSTMAASARLRAQQVLDKLRVGHRFESGVRALRRRLQGDAAQRVVELERAPAEAFLARSAAAGSGWLWLVYATDPYSETRGQRSMWIAQDLSRRGHQVIYLYWRWHHDEPIPDSGDANVLVVPIDQLPGLQAQLLRARTPRRVLLIEFPDVALYERINLFNAHGWTTVYDCVDEWQEFGRIGQAGWYDLDVERHLAREADVVVATHPLLATKLGAMAERVVPLVPNGVKLETLRAPEEPRSRDAGAPVIGYFGHLTSSWLDWDLLRASAARNPGWRFEIYGYGQPEHLDLPPNSTAPGMLPHAELGARTAHWSVGIIPFREGPLTRAIDPVKLYEYLALGMPVVAVGMPFLRDVPGVVVCDRGGFDEAVRSALATPFDRDRIAAFVEDSRWARRVDALLARIDDADPARNVVKALAG